jgi:hypothetical protein
MTNEMFEVEKRKRIALLIDGDNAQPSLTGKMLTEAGKYGLVTIRRIYGDWTTVNMQGWKHTLNENAIQPIQQFRYTVGKNSTDSAMIIDAMDILHSHLVDGFCLVSSDSDYTRLATRIREMGFFVMGIGKQSTPKAFVNACNLFIYTENLVPKKQQRPRKERPPAPKRGHGRSSSEPEPEPETDQEPESEGGEERQRRLDPVPLLRGAFDMAVEEGGWASLSTIGFYLRQLDPGFDPRTYGHKQLSQLIKSYQDIFEMKFQDDKGRTNVFLRIKES